MVGKYSIHGAYGVISRAITPLIGVMILGHLG